MKVIVCGGRDYKDRLTVFERLDIIHRCTPITLLIEGGAAARRYSNGWRNCFCNIASANSPKHWTAVVARRNRRRASNCGTGRWSWNLSGVLSRRPAPVATTSATEPA